MRQIIETQILEKIPVYFFCNFRPYKPNWSIEKNDEKAKKEKKRKMQNVREKKKLTGESKLLE